MDKNLLLIAANDGRSTRRIAAVLSSRYRIFRVTPENARRLQGMCASRRFAAVVAIVEHYVFTDFFPSEIRRLLPGVPVIVFLTASYCRSAYSFVNTAAFRGPLADFRIHKATTWSGVDCVVTESAGDTRRLRRDVERIPVVTIPFSAGCREKLFSVVGAPPRKAPPLTSIIIPCFNRFSLLRRCVQSVRKHTPLPYELILVDDGSKAPEAARMRTMRGTVYIRHAANRGFAAACNSGIRKARGKHVVLLNSDTVVTPGWLERMTACAENSAAIGMVGPRTNETFGAQKVEGCAYRSIARLDRWSVLFALKNDGAWRETHWLNGFCILIKRRVIERIGLLDEGYGKGTYEDYDYCARAREAGFRLYCAGNVFVHHEGGESFLPQARQRLLRINRQRFIKKWGYPVHEYLYYSIAHAVEEHRRDAPV